MEHESAHLNHGGVVRSVANAVESVALDSVDDLLLELSTGGARHVGGEADVDGHHFLTDGIPDTILGVHDGEELEAHHPLLDVLLRDLAEIKGHGGPDQVVSIWAHRAIVAEAHRTGVENVVEIVIESHRKISFQS